jgi:hypothetical protein
MGTRLLGLTRVGILIFLIIPRLSVEEVIEQKLQLDIYTDQIET